MYPSSRVRRASGSRYSTELVRALAGGRGHPGGAVRGGEGPRPRHRAAGHRGLDAGGGVSRLGVVLCPHRPLAGVAGPRLAGHRGVRGAGDRDERADRARERPGRHLGSGPRLRAEPHLHGRSGRRALGNAAEPARLCRHRPRRRRHGRTVARLRRRRHASAALSPARCAGCAPGRDLPRHALRRRSLGRAGARATELPRVLARRDRAAQSRPHRCTRAARAPYERAAAEPRDRGRPRRARLHRHRDADLGADDGAGLVRQRRAAPVRAHRGRARGALFREAEIGRRLAAAALACAGAVCLLLAR
jgi:hypothetical protein